jgi:signal transduction histidine kinase
MRSLFVRIFLAFWLIYSAMSAVTIFTMARSRPLDVENEFSRRIRSSVLTAARLAILRRQVEGNTGYLRAVDEFQRESRVQLWITTPDGRELADRSIPADTLATAHRSDLKMPLHTEQGDFVLYAEVPLRLLPPFRTDREMVQLIFGILISGVVCYSLALYLTRPIDQLRRAAQAIAQGDLSARAVARRNRDQIGYLVDDFNQMADRLQSTMAAQKQMISDISHELRSPLARLSVALELARARAGEGARTSLDRIELETSRLNDMIGRILALAQLTSGELHMKRERIDLSRIVREVVADADYEARSKHTSVKLTMGHDSEHAILDGFPSLLRSALENALRNAIAYTAPGTEIEVNQWHSAGNACITIRDHGQGVPESELSKLFLPFYRVDNSRTRHTGGSGLGLAIAARAIAVHHGTIAAHNAPDGGMIVDIRIPASSRLIPKQSTVAPLEA